MICIVLHNIILLLSIGIVINKQKSTQKYGTLYKKSNGLDRNFFDASQVLLQLNQNKALPYSDSLSDNSLEACRRRGKTKKGREDKKYKILQIM
uniref:Uncharacterized protein n=1 Tax=Romanomermis culicivorax TaxID=13658 RepID=A0A915KHS3_ROMCU